MRIYVAPRLSPSGVDFRGPMVLIRGGSSVAYGSATTDEFSFHNVRSLALRKSSAFARHGLTLGISEDAPQCVEVSAIEASAMAQHDGRGCAPEAHRT
jgi:hypothetical protein